MKIEKNIFDRHKPDFEKLQKFGFVKNGKNYNYEKYFMDNQFRADIQINANGELSAKVYDTASNDEYLPLRVEHNEGKFVGKVREAYIEILKEICDKCFLKTYFIFPQSNRITNALLKKYGDSPEFLWEKFQGSGIFRNPKTQKWYLAILDVEYSKIKKGAKSEIVEVADIKLAPEHVEYLKTQKDFYPAYHMNKKYWITVILNDSISDEKILELIEESHSYSEKK